MVKRVISTGKFTMNCSECVSTFEYQWADTEMKTKSFMGDRTRDVIESLPEELL